MISDSNTSWPVPATFAGPWRPSATQLRPANLSAIFSVIQVETKGITVREVAKDTNYLKKLVAKFQPRMKNRARYPEIEITLVDAPIPDGQSMHLALHDRWSGTAGDL